MLLPELYGYLNLESTKTISNVFPFVNKLYGYLNLESTKTVSEDVRG